MKNSTFFLLLLGLFCMQSTFANSIVPISLETSEGLQSLIENVNPYTTETQDELNTETINELLRVKLGASYEEWVDEVISLLILGVDIDNIKIRKDTTINIYGSGGMDNESGRICPDQAKAHCAKIVIHGKAVVDDAGGFGGPVEGTLTETATSKEYPVTIIEMSGVEALEDGTLGVDGMNVLLEVHSK